MDSHLGVLGRDRTPHGPPADGAQEKRLGRAKGLQKASVGGGGAGGEVST